MENHNGEKLVSFNFERIKYWMAKKARLSNPVAELLGTYVYIITILGISVDQRCAFTVLIFLI